jgi:hypothetical protein
MDAMPEKLCFALLLGAFLCASPAFAEWTSQLEAGGKVSVDPTTNRATVTRQGVSTPLWDGVHRLQDGSVITVRSGQVVPNEEILRAREQRPKALTDEAQAWVGTPIVGLSPCEKLVRRVCGDTQQCSQAPACDPARQLLDMERQERANSTHPGSMTYSSGQCQEATRDTEFFRQCAP